MSIWKRCKPKDLPQLLQLSQILPAERPPFQPAQPQKTAAAVPPPVTTPPSGGSMPPEGAALPQGRYPLAITQSSARVGRMRRSTPIRCVGVVT